MTAPTTLARLPHSPGRQGYKFGEDSESSLERATILEFDAGLPRPWAELESVGKGRFRARTAEVWAARGRADYDRELEAVTRWKSVERDKADLEIRREQRYLGSEAAAWTLTPEELAARGSRAVLYHRKKLDAIQAVAQKRVKAAARWLRKADSFRMCRRVGFLRKHVSETACKATEYTEFSCDIRGCELCGDRRVARLMDRYLPRIDAFLKSSLAKTHTVYELTLTTVNRKEGIPKAAYFAAFQRAVSEFMKLFFTNHGRAALGAQELGFNNTNLHGHFLVVGERRRRFQSWSDHPLGKDLLEIEWKRIARKHKVEGGFIWIKKSADPARALGHCLKYLTKPFSDDPAFFAEVILNTPEHFRTFRAWGWFSMKKTKGEHIEEIRRLEREIRAGEKKSQAPADNKCPLCGMRTELDALDVRPVFELRMIGALTHLELWAVARGSG